MGGIKNRGFASMTKERRKEISRMGGQKSPGNFKHNPKRASEMGRKSTFLREQAKLKTQQASAEE